MNMSSIRRSALVALSLIALPAMSLAAQGGQKIAFINSHEVLAKAPGRAEAEAAYNKEMDGYRTEVQRMGDSLQTMIADYQKAEASLSAAQKDQRQKTIRDKQEQYQKRVGELQEHAQQREMEIMQPLMDQIRKILDEIRQEEGYAFILDAGSDANVIVAADRNLDLTNKVISRLKPMTVSAPAAKPPAATGARPAPAGVTRKPPTQ